MSSDCPSKQQTLRANGTLHPHPDKSRDPLFQSVAFFDACDLLQVKYEMVRRVELEGWSVTRAAEAFGFSRPAFYQARTAFEQDGLWGLIPKKRGPKDAYKLSADVMSWGVPLLHTTPPLGADQLAGHLYAHFGLAVHRRSIERALERLEKKRKETS